MSPRQGLVLVTDDSETVSAVAAAVERNGELAAEGVCSDLGQLVAVLQHTPAAAVLVDIDPGPKGMLAALDSIITRFANTRFIVLSSAGSNDLILEAMQAGARHFLVKQSIVTHLADVLQRLAPNGSAKTGKRGAAITVLAASGGCGATTIAVNLANELQLASAEPALLVDLDCSYGAVASYLGLEGQYGLADVLVSRSRIDRHLITSTAVPYSEGLQVLLSPVSIDPGKPAQLVYPHLGDALHACKRAYRFTVVDAPRVSMDVAVSLADASQVTLIVFQLAVKDIRAARSTVGILTERGIPAARIVPLVNRYRKRHSTVTLQDAEAALGEVPPRCVHNDFRSASRAIDYGQPLAQAARRSVLRRDLGQLAAELVEAHSHGVAIVAS